MGSTKRTTATDLEASVAPGVSDDMGSDNFDSLLPKNVRGYNFYQLVELLHNIGELDPEDEVSTSSKILFGANPGLGFAASDVSALDAVEGDRLRLETTFFGMSGAQSPLPGFFIEDILTESEETGLRKPFLDFFNHRLLTLVYQVWRKYRYYIRFREGATDAFSAQLFALVGLADENLRGETPINWCKMLSYAGVLAGRSRSPQVVAGIIAHCFDLEDVSIRQWELRHVDIPEEQKMRLGMANAAIGMNSVIGSKVGDRSGKFVICINGLTQARFRDFLPSGKEYLPLITLVEFVLREQMAFDLELGIKHDEAPPMQLSQSKPASLGWSSFTGVTDKPRIVRIQIRQ
ncbi:type VI secretion system baseplate subunit TssG [Enterovibrio calviensis]|uniref:type VI secretion system baseplate subunit TssG n=1 Tax=Enterovibrio calviensis TaxID=91359 RepID=UPI00048603BF|nr:type VI secretion system baseplate subunit TssG [Enterovibrio calviensis]